MPTASQLDAAYESVSAAMVRIEDRLPRADTEDEKNFLRAAYAKLMELLQDIALGQLTISANKVASSVAKLQKVVDSATVGSFPSYMKKLRKSLKKIGANIPAHNSDIFAELVDDESDGSAVIDEPSTDSSIMVPNADPDITLWQDLIETYQSFGNVTDQMKVVSLSQWILESRRGTSELATKHNNFGGLKFRERMKDHAVFVDYLGTGDHGLTGYCKFDSIKSFLKGYWHFIDSGPYDGWEFFKDDAAGYIRHIAPSYAGDGQYLSKVLGLFEEAENLLNLGHAVSDVGSGNGQINWRVAIVVGHNSVAQGAFAGSPINSSEFNLNNKVAAEIINQAPHYSIKAKVFNRKKHPNGYSREIREVYKKVTSWSGGKPDAILELHFNANSNKSANGLEMLYRTGSADGARLAKAVVATVNDQLDLKLRHSNGLKDISSGMRGWGTVSALPGIPTILTEPFFGSNKHDRLRMAEVGVHGLALSYLRGVRDFLAS